jgi:ankyrin repeat protein
VAYTALKHLQDEGKSLCVAARYGHVDIVNLLLENKVDINSVDIDQVREKKTRPDIEARKTKHSKSMIFLENTKDYFLKKILKICKIHATITY